MSTSKSIAPISHSVDRLIELFNHTFYSRFNTRLIRGTDEPIYLPANDLVAYHQVVFAHGYFSSALHEISHWCIAGEERRLLTDYGYWYAPDGRDEEQQRQFQSVEVLPQAIEWAFCLACGLEFTISSDNLTGNKADELAFKSKVANKLAQLLAEGYPHRAEEFIQVLKTEYYPESVYQPISRQFVLGLVINPYAGIGGAVALKGSDGADVRAQALAQGAIPLANQKTTTALQELLAYQSQLVIKTASGQMGEDCAKALGFATQVVYTHPHAQTEASDTQAAVQALLAQGVDCILFAGGDGTARNICDVVPAHIPVLGVPAGCKIHSGVYAITPRAAGCVIADMIDGKLVSVQEAEVRDIDEAAFRQGKVIAKHFGELTVPAQLQYVQSVKMGGKESDEMVLADLAAYIGELRDEYVPCNWIMGSGSTIDFIMQELGFSNTLLGVDVILSNGELKQDMRAYELLPLSQNTPSKLLITLIGGQGHIFGRGNQQLSPEVIRTLGKDNIIVVATKTKLQQLQGQPLICDTGDTQLDASLDGLIEVITGYNDKVLYPIGVSYSQGSKKKLSFAEFIDAVEQDLDNIVVNGSDDELFISSYFHGHFSLAVSMVSDTSQDLLSSLDEILTQNLTDAFTNQELDKPDQQKIWNLWQRLRNTY